ncbi:MULTISPECIES: TRAP transporter small permease [unclassified Paenibacillus]|uniref:TRAP transporter small permease n=1 Tax=unclassified Paenibacillus TaxID=185978 RepID=UPI0010503C7A|nr:MULTISPECIES: TRAP transporter small permease [unclassified Paenibacillus]NIK70823.1 TRAP-type C4-dicarboxylate transport system permease small subunit [Paenibacillus sp. BK720]TCM93206.1 TRAP-type C4-dicarboxylate transport system permease small subunit [Paenibacillus sp. BK033]
MKTLKKIALAIDTLLETVTLIGLVTMIIIVTVQVFTRKVFSFVFHSSEEITMLLMVWFSFLGIAFGFREHLHMGIDSFTSKLPKAVNYVLDKVIGITIFAFGVYLLHYGWDFTKLMSESELPATGWPNSLLYLVMPITGVLVCVYAILQLIGIDTRRHKGLGGHE